MAPIEDWIELRRGQVVGGRQWPIEPTGRYVPEAEVERLREAIQGILAAWPRHLYDVPQEAVDQFVAAMDRAQEMVDRG